MAVILQVTGDDATTLDSRLGLVSDRISYVADTKLEALSYQPKELIVPEITRNVRRRVDGRFDLFISCEGHPAPESADGHEYQLEGTTNDSPIETHWNISEILEKYTNGGKPDPKTNKIKFPLHLSIDGEQVVNEMYGVEAFLEPGLVWSHSFVSLRIEHEWVKALGTIDTPDQGPEGQIPPELDGKRFWFNVRMTAAWRGNIWKISRSWMLTGRRGFVPELYKRQ